MNLVLAWLLRDPVKAVALIAMTGFAVTAYVYGQQRDSARAELRALEQDYELAMLQADADRRKAERDQAEITRRVADALSVDRERERDRAASLSERLRDRENRLRACALSQATGATGGAPGGSQEPGGSAEIGEAIAALPGACLDDAARLAAWQQWWRDLAANANPPK